MNYEVNEGVITSTEDIVAHARREKENSSLNTTDITANATSRAVQDIFGNSVRKIVKRVGKSVQRAFENLSKRRITLISQSDIDFKQEWCTLRHNAPEIAKESGDGKWKTLISNQFDVSFRRFEESRCDDKVMVSEASFHNNSQEKKIQMKIMYDQFTVSPQLTKTINDQQSGLPIMERAKSVTSLMDTSYVCRGFLASENSETLELYKVKVQKHLITEQLRSGNITENRPVLFLFGYSQCRRILGGGLKVAEVF